MQGKPYVPKKVLHESSAANNKNNNKTAINVAITKQREVNPKVMAGSPLSGAHVFAAYWAKKPEEREAGIVVTDIEAQPKPSMEAVSSSAGKGTGLPKNQGDVHEARPRRTSDDVVPMLDPVSDISNAEDDTFEIGNLLSSFEYSCSMFSNKMDKAEEEIVFGDNTGHDLSVVSADISDPIAVLRGMVRGDISTVASARTLQDEGEEVELTSASNQDECILSLQNSSTVDDDVEQSFRDSNLRLLPPGVLTSSKLSVPDGGGGAAAATVAPTSSSHEGTSNGNKATRSPPRSLRGITLISILLFVFGLGIICGVGFAVIDRRAEEKASQQQQETIISWTSDPTRSPVAVATGPSMATTSSPTATSPLQEPTAATPSALTATMAPSAPSTATSTAMNITVGGTSSNSSFVLPLPPYPSFRFIPWSQIPSIAQQLASKYLGYTEETWNLPGTANRADPTKFYEGISFTFIQNKYADLGAISTIAQLGFQQTTWDCWVNHFQNFTWGDLSLVSPIEVTFVQGMTNLTTYNTTMTDRLDSLTDSSVVIGGRDIHEAMLTLGWTAETWATPERMEFFFPTSTSTGRPLWSELTPQQQDAASDLCYTPELWDRIPIPEWEGNQ